MRRFRVIAWRRWLAVASGLVSAAIGRAEIHQLTIRVADEQARPAAARVLVLDRQGRSHVAPVASTVNIGPDTWFLCEGSARLDVPAGLYDLQVEHGPEYGVAQATVDVQENMLRELRLHRWFNARARGYQSGENHLHVPAAAVPAHLAAEDLDYGSSLYWWNGPKLPDPPRELRQLPNISVYDAEVENGWGAVYCIGLTQPLSLAWNPARSNFAYVDAARAAGAVVAYQGGWSREALVDAVLGKVDVINIGDNLFQRHKFMPRARNSNLLEVPGLPNYPNTAEGMLALATESYYRLLNCGLHLAAGAGSATGVKSNPAGYTRAYVRVSEHASVAEFLAAWRAGRNFITNGPMVFLTVDRCVPGDTLALPSGGGAVRVRVETSSSYPLREVAFVVNGRRILTGHEDVIEATITLKEGAWVAAIAIADEPTSDLEIARYRQQSRLGGEEPTRMHFAHTSPVYVTVGGAGARVPESIAQAKRMLDAFEAFARKTAAPEFQLEVLQAVVAARAKL